MRKIVSLTVDILLGIILIVSLIAFAAPKLFGGSTLTILTDSMSPKIKAGDVVILKKPKWDDIGIGTIITFQPKSNDPMLITHRVIAKNTGVNKFITTKGDANGAADKTIKFEQVKGEVIYKVDKIGYASQFIKKHKPITFGALAGLVILAFIIPSDDKKNDKNLNNNDNNLSSRTKKKTINNSGSTKVEDDDDNQ